MNRKASECKDELRNSTHIDEQGRQVVIETAEYEPVSGRVATDSKPGDRRRLDRAGAGRSSPL